MLLLQHKIVSKSLMRLFMLHYILIYVENLCIECTLYSAVCNGSIVFDFLSKTFFIFVKRSSCKLISHLKLHHFLSILLKIFPNYNAPFVSVLNCVQIFMQYNFKIIDFPQRKLQFFKFGEKIHKIPKKGKRKSSQKRGKKLKI